MRVSAEAKVGLVLLLSLLLLGSMAVAVGRIDLRPGSGYELFIRYRHVDGLREGAPVRFAGVHVGKVSFVRLERDGVLVGLRLDRDLPIPADSRFSIASAGVLGEKHIEIQPGRAEQALAWSQEVAGTDPVMLDEMLGQVDTALGQLNQITTGFAGLMDSELLEANLLTTTTAVVETIQGFQETVQHVNEIMTTVQSIALRLDELTEQTAQTDIAAVAANVEKFTKQLAALDLVYVEGELSAALADVRGFTDALADVPVLEMGSELQSFTSQLAAVDLAGMERELRGFTAMLADVDLRPVLDEIALLTQDIRDASAQLVEQFADLGLAERAEELALFTGELAQFPIAAVGEDLTAFSARLHAIPLEGIAESVEDITRQFAALPVAEMGERIEEIPIEELTQRFEAVLADLQTVSSQLAYLEIEAIGANLHQFSGRLAEVDIQTALDDAAAEVKATLAEITALGIEPILAELQATASHFRAVSAAVQPEDVELFADQLLSAAEEVQQASIRFREMVGGLADSAQSLTVDVDSMASEAELATAALTQTIADTQAVVHDIQAFVSDLVDEGATAASIKAIVQEVEGTVAELQASFDMVKTELPLTPETVADIREAMDNVKKLNRDIQTLRGVGETVTVDSRWGLSLSPQPEADQSLSLGAGVGLEFHPENRSDFFVVGLRDIPFSNLLQLQYGQTTGSLRQRYGIIDSKLGLGLDAPVGEHWMLSLELSDVSFLREQDVWPRLTLGTQYQWDDDWRIRIAFDDALNWLQSEPGERGVPIRTTIERRF